MAVLKCKMCGGDLVITEGSSVCKCEYCGTPQTVPCLDNEKKTNLFARANRLRFGCEFDKAYSVYESIAEEFTTEAEAYWGLVLCKYGIEYVDDPKTGKKIPTCHRSSFESIFDDSNFELTLENADAVARTLYREEAKAIEEIRKSIIEVSSKEEPYDIFICYKETDERNNRTIDSVIAQDVYEALTEKGYRVFFSRISLEDKLGKEYEPYIFSALHSAKIMLVFGTDYEYFNAVWVKNEWSRFLKLMEQDSQKTLIPCYKGIDAYDMPREFARLQAQDMGKVGAIQDLLRGIGKILKPIKKETIVQTVVNSGSLSSFSAPLIQRGCDFLREEKFEKSQEFFEKALDYEPDNEDALLGMFLASVKVSYIEDLSNLSTLFENNNNYQLLSKHCSKEITEEIIVQKSKILENMLNPAAAFLKRGNYNQAKKVYENYLNTIKTIKGNNLDFIPISQKEIELKILECDKNLHLENTKQKRKKLVIFLTIVCPIILAIIIGTAYAIIYSSNEKIYGVDKVGNGYVLKDGSKYSPSENGHINIPLEVNGKPVTEISYQAFQNRNDIKSVTIPNSVISIGNWAFDGCGNLTSVTIGDSVTTIGEAAFSNCISLKNIDIPNSVKVIGKHAFYSCNSLTSVTIGKGVTRIDDTAFCYCYSLSEIKIPNSVTAIGDSAFSNCTSLMKATIPNSVSYVGSGIFSSCPIITIYVEASAKPNGWNNDWNHWDSTVIWGSNDGGTLENGLRWIAKNGRASIIEYVGNKTSISIPTEIDGYEVEAIGTSAFEANRFLTSVVIDTSVTTIGDSAFYNCDSLTSVVIGDSVTTIGENAFYNCDSLTSIVIPDSVTTIGKSAFCDCDALTSIVIPESVTTIGDYAFFDCDYLTSVVIPNSVTSIGDGAFYHCDALTSVVIGDSVTTIGENAFYNCDSLTSVVIGDSVTTIGENAFYNCDALTSIVIPDSVTTIGNSAFFDCDALTNIVIPDSVTIIGEHAFFGCDHLTSVVIPNSVTTIGEHAFARCDSLTIYAEAQSKPSGWDSYWNSSSRPVVWGYKG